MLLAERDSSPIRRVVNVLTQTEARLS